MAGSSRVVRLGLLVGIAFGAVLGGWRLAAGAAPAQALLWALAAVGVSVSLAGLSALGIRLQRRDLPRPDR